MPLSGDSLKAMEELFDAFDMAKTGKIGPKEIGEGFALVGAPPQMIQVEVGTLMTRATGSDNKLTKEMFTVADYSVAGRPAKWLATAITKNREAEKARAEQEKKNAAFKVEVDKKSGIPKWEALLGKSVIGSDGKTTDLKTAFGDADHVGIYFSAHWCPPCRRFTPKFAKIYSQMRKDGKKFQAVFVTCDKNQKAFDEYFNEMPWTAVPFTAKEFTGFDGKAASYVGVNGIPNLAIFNKDGKLVAGNGVELVMKFEDNFLSKM